MALNKSHVIARLTKARDKIATGRWRRGQLVKLDAKGQVYAACAVGALNVVDPGFKRYTTNTGVKSYHIANTNRDLVRECTDELNYTTFNKCHRNIIDFNDQVARDKRDVVRVFDATIKRLKAS